MGVLVGVMEVGAGISIALWDKAVVIPDGAGLVGECGSASCHKVC